MVAYRDIRDFIVKVAMADTIVVPVDDGPCGGGVPTGAAVLKEAEELMHESVPVDTASSGTSAEEAAEQAGEATIVAETAAEKAGEKAAKKAATALKPVKATGKAKAKAKGKAKAKAKGKAKEKATAHVVASGRPDASAQTTGQVAPPSSMKRPASLVGSKVVKPRPATHAPAAAVASQTTSQPVHSGPAVDATATGGPTGGAAVMATVSAADRVTQLRDRMKAAKFNSLWKNRALPHECMQLVDEVTNKFKSGGVVPLFH